MLAIKLPEINFDGLNEADVRAEVIDPLLRGLGYQSGTENNILRERLVDLRYPHIFLGRKKAGDPTLRGRPDYICEIRGFTRWIVEAKPPSEEIGLDDVEQAHSYAAHPEIRAPIYALCNGREFIVYETSRPPSSEPLLRLSYDELRDRHYVFENLLSPIALRKRYPTRPIDLRKPIARGFGSRAKIVGGFSRYDEVELMLDGLPPGVAIPSLPDLSRLKGLEAAITGVECYRDEIGGIIADIHMPKMHELMRTASTALDLDVNRYVSADDTISTDPERPSIFELTLQRFIPAGMETFDFVQWASVKVPVNMHMTFYAEATGYLNGHVFQGRYDGRILARQEIPFLNLTTWVFMRGTYAVEIEK